MRATLMPKLFSSASLTASSAVSRLVSGLAAAGCWAGWGACAKTDADVPKTAIKSAATLTRITIVRIFPNSTPGTIAGWQGLVCGPALTCRVFRTRPGLRTVNLCFRRTADAGCSDGAKGILAQNGVNQY